MNDFKIGQLIWFIKEESKNKFRSLAFVRTSKGGALIIGGSTGTHFTGHGESWKKKLEMVLTEGFISFDEAQRRGMIQTPLIFPDLTKSEQEFLEQIQEGII